jgi:hypothetical protein
MDRDDAPAAAEAARGMEGRCAGASAVAQGLEGGVLAV